MLSDSGTRLKSSLRIYPRKKEKYEKAGLTYIQTGLEGIALAEAKEEAKKQDEEESSTKPTEEEE